MRNKLITFVNRQWTMDNGRSPRGFTLLELLIYTGMLMVLLSVFATLFGMIVDAKLESDATSAVQQDEQYLLMKLSQDISSASSVNTPATLGSSANTLQLTNNSVDYTYSLDGNGNLTISTTSGTDMLNSFQTSISNLQFTRLGKAGGKPTIQFTFQVTSRTRQSTGYETDIATSTASLR